MSINQRKQIAKSRFPATAGKLSVIRDTVHRAAANCSCSKEIIDGLVMATNEACANIIKHGYGEKNPGEIVLEVFLNQKELIIRITDFAPHIDANTFKGRELDEIRPGGLGIFFMHELTDRIEYPEVAHGIGNIIELIKVIK